MGPSVQVTHEQATWEGRPKRSDIQDEFLNCLFVSKKQQTTPGSPLTELSQRRVVHPSGRGPGRHLERRSKHRHPLFQGLDSGCQILN